MYDDIDLAMAVVCPLILTRRRHSVRYCRFSGYCSHVVKTLENVVAISSGRDLIARFGPYIPHLQSKRYQWKESVVTVGCDSKAADLIFWTWLVYMIEVALE